MKTNMTRFTGIPTRSTLRNFLSEFDRTFNEFSNDIVSVLPKFFTPKVNIYKKEGKYFLDFYVPFTKKEDISIDIDENILIVHVENHQDDSIKDEEYLFREISRGQATRQMYLGDDFDQDSIEANLKDGILQLSFKSIEANKPQKPAKKIEVK